MAKHYDDSSIDLQLGSARIRKRPASMLGSTGRDGARHGFTEIYGNALDEFSTGHGDRMDVEYYTDGSMSIRDYGRGVPLGWNEKHQSYNWHIIYNELYGGGKYEDAQVELAKVTDWENFDESKFNYLFSVGLNGLGAASTQYTSEFFDVTSIRKDPVSGKNMKTEMHFKKGIPIIDGEPNDVFLTGYDFTTYKQVSVETEEETGTLIHWKPDDEVFTDINVGGDWIFEKCKDIASVSGVELHFVNHQTGFNTVVKAKGLDGVIYENCGKNIVADESGNLPIFQTSQFSHGVTKVEGKDFIWVCKAEVAFTMTKKDIPHSCFHNSVRTISGRQYDAIKDALFAFIKEKGQARGVKVDAKDYVDAFSFVVSSHSNYTSTRNQTKDAVEDMFIYNIILDTILKKLQLEYGKGTPAITDVVDRIIREAEIRIATKEQAKLIREAVKVKREKAPEKFSSCDAYEQKKYKDVELWITEGDSAKGAVKNARSKVFQAIYPIRGKGLNVAKKGIDKALKNKEIREIFSLLGTGFDLNIEGEKLFNIDDLKCDKIILATDADVDGQQIRVLLFLIFYVLAPRIITEGHLYIAETPRFSIELTNGETLYVLNDADRDAKLQEYSGRVKKVSRFKGLGEVNPDVLRKTTVHPDTRTLFQVTCDLENATERELIDALFGADKFNQRKSIITTILGCDVADMLNDNALLIQEIDDEDIEDGIDYQEV